MKQFAELLPRNYEKVPAPATALQTRSAKEDIISQIVERMTGDRKEHAKLIALWVNRYHITETDLHALLKKATDPTIRNFTAFVRWSIKDAWKAN